MKIAIKSMLLLLVFYLFMLGLIVIWIQSDLRTAAKGVMEDTALLIGRQVNAALHEVVMERLLSGDPQTRATLKKTVETTRERSTLVTSIDVLDAQGKVVASDDENQLGRRYPNARELFAEERAPRTLSTFDKWFSLGKHTLFIPLTQQGELLGYLRMSLDNQPIAALFDQVYARLLIVALLGLVAVVGLGLLLQFQFNRLSKGLSKLLEGIMKDTVDPVLIVKDEFVGVRQAAGKVGQKLREARSEAELARRELDTLARVVKIGIILLGPEGKTEFISDAAKEMLVGSRLENLGMCLQAHKTNLDKVIARMRQDGTQVDKLDLEVGIEGTSRRLRLEFYALDQRQWKGCLVLMKDREMIDALEADLRAATRLRGLSRLYTGAAHDIRAPLNAMVINLELLQQTLAQSASLDKAERRGQQGRYVSILLQELKRLNTLLSVLLEQGKPAYSGSRAGFDLREIIKGLTILLTPQARRQQVLLKIDLPQQPVEIFGDSGQLQQALLNILVNGLEAMPKGGELTVQLTMVVKQALLVICDTGPGIPSALIGKIFEMHFTTRDTGTGVGLYVSRTVIERHQGEIQVETELGKGTCFRVTLPIYTGERVSANRTLSTNGNLLTGES
jgi:signal transduction histidine kinase